MASGTEASDMLAGSHRVDKNELYSIHSWDQGLEGLPDVTEEISEDEYRLIKYNVLIKSSGGDAQRFHSNYRFPAMIQSSQILQEHLSCT